MIPAVGETYLGNSFPGLGTHILETLSSPKRGLLGFKKHGDFAVILRSRNLLHMKAIEGSKTVSINGKGFDGNDEQNRTDFNEFLTNGHARSSASCQSGKHFSQLFTVGKSTNIHWHGCSVEKVDQQKLLDQKGCLIWITGLSGSDSGVICIASLISPYRIDCDACRTLLPNGDFIEVFMDVPLQICEARDPKGLYKLPRAGKIKGFTGIDNPYEVPLNSEIVLKHEEPCASPTNLAEKVTLYLEVKGNLQA